MVTVTQMAKKSRRRRVDSICNTGVFLCTLAYNPQIIKVNCETAILSRAVTQVFRRSFFHFLSNYLPFVCSGIYHWSVLRNARICRWIGNTIQMDPLDCPSCMMILSLAFSSLTVVPNSSSIASSHLDEACILRHRPDASSPYLGTVECWSHILYSSHS
jgi:hypothetical protein